MRQLILIALLLLCLVKAGAQPTVLQKNVTVAFAGVPLEKALATLKKRYGLHFSFTTNQMPLSQRVSGSFENQPLSQVLAEIFRGTGVSYQLVGDQIVLRTDGRPRAAATDARPAYPVITRIRFIAPPVASTRPAPVVRQLHIEPVPVPVAQPDFNAQRRRHNRENVNHLTGQVGDAVQTAARTVADETGQIVRTMNRNVKKMVQDRPPAASVRKTGSSGAPPPPTAPDSAADRPEAVPALPPADTAASETRPFQITFVHPVGSNGARNRHIVNHVSFNVLVGSAGGVDGAEFGGIANLNKGRMRGGQFAGMFNIVGGPVQGAQFAGFANITKQAVQGAQFAGFANLARGSATGGGQFAGFVNVAKGPVSAVQAAGFVNVAKGDAHGLQAAGFTNITQGDVDGAQLAGFVNIARHVKGVQIGVVNIADSVSGVQIGLLNFARHGYRRFELWGGEALYANAAFKMGTPHFHNVFAVGYRTAGSRTYVAYGLGFGSELALGGRTALNLDLLSWQVNVDEIWTETLNQLNQFRAMFGIRLAGRAKLFLGPTFNVYVSNLYDSEKGRYGLPPAPWNAVYDRTHGRTHVVMWPGFNAGIRF